MAVVPSANLTDYNMQITFGAADAKELLALLEEGGGAAMAVGAARAPAADITSAVVRPSRCTPGEGGLSTPCKAYHQQHVLSEADFGMLWRRWRVVETS
jgi:hypothetical protein